MAYTVKQVAEMTGVSVRTLHYYDEIGLLKASFRKENLYRSYEGKELLKLQQILFFRKLEFSLDEIMRILNSPSFDLYEALQDHKRLLTLKRNHITDLLYTIETTIAKLKESKQMNTSNLFSSFTDKRLDQYKEEVKAKWGGTIAHRQSSQRTEKWTEAQFQEILEEEKQITRSLANLMEKGVSDSAVQEQIALHYQHINRFYDCPYTMYRNLGKMYAKDIRFAAVYNHAHPRLAEFMRDAIAHYCERHI